ncbi:hypothetical protein [Natrialbaceae archaeon AArc-T1-2]|uniref:hypothetical protein n=1 Tax=Natrialbaceae archaeon AArc-T1-2 TaxID=3053904 RepID=UPI00255B1C87|nr:hypothetical protein [Natrialbaceae archaeon AArc-T1-2]WIV66697.1 hypothetical protein QQ977_13500 [Natrialbaceae archaeon AArc-T1-2]
MDPLAIGLAVAAVVAGVAVVVAAKRDDDRRDHRRRLQNRLAETLPSGTETHLEHSPTVRDLVVVDYEDGEATYVPVVRIDLETTDAPGLDLLVEYVADVLETIHPELEDERVRHYDVQFTFGPDGLFVPSECRRIAVPPTMAERLVADADYRAHDLQRDLEDGDDGGADAPVVWSDCEDYDDDAAAAAASAGGTASVP